MKGLGYGGVAGGRGGDHGDAETSTLMKASTSVRAGICFSFRPQKRDSSVAHSPQ